MKRLDALGVTPYRDTARTLTKIYRTVAAAKRTYPTTLIGVNANTSPAAIITTMISAAFAGIVPSTSNGLGI
ncbi:MAG: hypothetical protein ACXV5I_07075 [Halobacteriota archaeon]